jgi:dienelactone hydrolase
VTGELAETPADADSAAAPYDPFSAGRFPVAEFAFAARDHARERLFPCQLWYPDRAGATDEGSNGALPLVIFSHHSGGDRRSSSFLCTHLASHGYAVAALDHSEVVAAELSGGEGETADDRQARIHAIIGSRVPDVRFLLDVLLGQQARDAADAGQPDSEHPAPSPGPAAPAGITFDSARIGVAGHSFGGWTALAAPESEPRVRAVVALGPGGSSDPMPGVLPLTLTFGWGREVPVLILAAENDVPIPLDGVREIFGRTPPPRQMFILRRADHQHFVDDVEGDHEAVRAMTFPGDAAWIPAAMRPVTELASGDQAHLFTRGLTLAHFDAALRQSEDAASFLAGDVRSELAARGVDALAQEP